MNAAPPMTEPKRQQRKRASDVSKYVFDLVVSVVLMILLSPVMIVTAILIAWKLGRPIVFTQKRPGLDGRIFTMYKFRSMRNTTDSNGRLLSDAERLTPFGKFLRAASLDELPELFNVLRGEMSLVGPRPLLVQYLERYSDEQARRHEVRPGITGWAQVNGRNAIDWDQKFKLDVWYVDHRSLWLDIKIIFMTILKVVRRSDVSADNHVTMPEFLGNGADKGSVT